MEEIKKNNKIYSRRRYIDKTIFTLFKVQVY